MKVIDINSRDILSDKQKNTKILIYDISYKTSMDSIPLCIRINE